MLLEMGGEAAMEQSVDSGGQAGDGRRRCTSTCSTAGEDGVLLTASRAVAEDAVHEMFARSASRLGSLQHPSTCVRATVVNEYRSHRRRAGASVRLIPPPPRGACRRARSLPAGRCNPSRRSSRGGSGGRLGPSEDWSVRQLPQGSSAPRCRVAIGRCSPLTVTRRRPDRWWSQHGPAPRSGRCLSSS